jgi:(3,5-dihydroxyphenyl)acetyl-CoA 1,2-dioxygenase
MPSNATIAKARERSDIPSMPQLGSSLAKDTSAVGQYLQAVGKELQQLGPPPERKGSARSRAQEVKGKARELREGFFRRHAAEIYDEITRGCTVPLRLSDVVYKAADAYPGLLPTRAEIAAERALKRQIAKEGREIDQGLFVAYVLADERCGRHLVHAMLKPKREAEQRLSEFRRTGRVDLGSAAVERRDNVGEVTLTNPKFLNAEDDAASAALETGVDLVLLDDAIEVGVLRGAVLDHPKYKQKRVFNAGINLTHLYYGQISFIEFIVERELGLLNKIYRGHWMSESYHEQFEDYVEKPWLAVVDSFAIGGGCQLLCVMDRVIAEPDCYFNLPASKEGFIPGSANLRLPRLVGIHLARQGIFFERPFPANTPEGMMICDEVVPAAEMDAAINRNTAQMVRAGFTSTVSNRKALRVGQEPLDVYRRYMATYSRQQCLCLYDQKLIDNLENMWEPQRRRM